MYGYNPFQWNALNQWPTQSQWPASAPYPTQAQYAQPAQFSPSAQYPVQAPTPELTQWLARIEGQINLLTQTLQAHAITSNLQHAPMFNGAFAPSAHAHNTTGLNNSPIRLRESDTHIFCDIFLPQITMGDIEVEVSGNRILCRTRVPVPSFVRQFSSLWNAPRGFEFFELPDGRLECSWLCPVLFHAKDVEATFREGFISICVPKAEATTSRQTVKITQEKAGRRTASEMNS